MAALLDTQAGADPRQPHGASYDLTLPSIDAHVKGRRIGWLGDWGGAFPMEAGLMSHSEEAIPQLEALGIIVEPVAPPFSADAIWESWTTLRSWAIAGGLSVFYNDASKRDQLKPEAIWEIERGLSFSAMDVHRASVLRSDWFKICSTLFEHYDALVLPTTQLYPFPVEWTYPTEIGGQAMDTYHRWMHIVTPVGLIGLPCINIPLEMGANGLPAGLSLFGPRDSDAALMQLGQAWHKAYHYSLSRAPLS
jgi:amidase